MKLTEEYSGASLPPDLDYSDPKVVAAFTAAADHFRKTNMNVTNEFAHYRGEIAMSKAREENLKERLLDAYASLGRDGRLINRLLAQRTRARKSRNMWATIAIIFGTFDIVRSFFV